MADTFHLKIVASDKMFFEGFCEMLAFPGLDGSHGVLPRHESMVTTVADGEIRFKTDGQWQTAVVTEGFIDISPDEVILLSNTVERPEDIDRKRALEAKERAEERLRQRESMKEYYYTQAALARAMARLKAVKK